MRRASAAVWESENPILNVGEPGYDMTNHAIKIGDGTSTWNQLGYENALSIRSKTSSTNCLDDLVLMDFGDEDAIPVSAMEASVLDNSSYPDHILPSSGGVQSVPVGGVAGIMELMSGTTEDDIVATANTDGEDLSGVDEELNPE